MAGYTYTAPTSGYSGTIAQLLARRGEIAAAAAESIGAANARAAEQSGNAWAGAAQTIGQSVAAVPAQQQREKTLAVDAALKKQALDAGALRLASDQRASAGQTAMAGLMTDPQGPAPEGQPAPSNPYLKKEGDVAVWDVEGLSKAMAAQGFGDLSPQVVKDVGSLNQAHRDEAASRAKFGADQQNVMARGAGAALGMLRDHPTADPKLIVGFIGDQMKANGTFPPDKIDAVTQQLLADPAQLQTRLELLSRSSTLAPVALKDKEKLLNPTDVGGKPLADNSDPNEGSYTINGQRFTKDGKPIGAIVPTQAAPKSIESKNVLLDGKPAIVNFNPANGAHTLPDGTDVSTRVKPIPAASTIINPAAATDVKETVAGMKDGTLPPMMPGRATKEYLATMAEAHRQGYDLQGAVTDWNATQKHIATMNGAQQLRLNQSINALPDMLDKVDALAAQWHGGRFPALNSANLALAKGGAYGSDVASIATQLDAQIADVTADLGNVYMGGNSPTDHALGLAGKSLSGTWDEKVLHDMTKLARGNVQIRGNSIKNTGVAGVGADNPYAPKVAPPPAPAATGPTVGERRMISGQLGEWDGKGWKAVVPR